MAKAKILIVDDDPAIRLLIKHLLMTKRLGGIEAESGAQALALLEESAFDLVITDLRMPKMNGLELLRKVRQVAPTTPVIIVTAYASTDTTIKSIHLGVFDYLAKPFKVDDLIGAVEQALTCEKGKISATDGYAGNNPLIKEYLALKAARRRKKAEKP